MSDTPEPNAPAPELRERLAELAQRLREPGSLDPLSRQALAELVAGLSHALEKAPMTGPEVANLAQSTAQLADSLHPHPDPGLVASAREHLVKAAYDLEAHAPVVSGLAYRLLEVLANIGI